MLIMRKITFPTALVLAMALSIPAIANHDPASNRGGQHPQGYEKAHGKASSKARGQVNDWDNALEDSGPGNDGKADTTTGDPGNSLDKNQAGDQ